MNVLPEADEKATVVQTMFDRIAPSYDRMNRLITLGFDQRWRRSLIDALGVRAGDTVLDLACGTGDFASSRESAGRRWWGWTSRGRCSPPHASAARTRSGSCGETRCGCRWASGSFSVAVSGFALRNFVAIPPVLEELARVLRPGGRVGLLEVDEPRSGLLRLGHGLYFQRVVPALGALLSDGGPTAICRLRRRTCPTGRGCA